MIQHIDASSSIVSVNLVTRIRTNLAAQIWSYLSPGALRLFDRWINSLVGEQPVDGGELLLQLASGADP